VIDRPHRRNALTAPMYFGVRVAVDRTDNDDSLAGLMITGTADVFAPGGDLGADSEDEGANLPAALGMEITPFDSLRQARKPVVSAVNGLCQGGGLMIAMLSDVAVVSDRATFRAPELFRGIADTHYAQILSRQIGPARARDMLMSGRVVTAEEAVDWGMVSRLVPHDELIDAATEVLESCCRAAPAARLDLKRTFDQYYGLYDRIGMAASLRGPEAIEGFVSFKARRSPDWVHADLRREGRL
jgi:enoyl-CoA hydratase/carnithine racemase